MLPACLSLLAGEWGLSVADAAAITAPSVNDNQLLWSPNRMTIYCPGTCWAFSTELGLLRHALSGPEEKLLGPQPPVTQTTTVGVPSSNYTSSAGKPPSLSVCVSLSLGCVCSNPLGAVRPRYQSFPEFLKASWESLAGNHSSEGYHFSTWIAKAACTSALHSRSAQP